MFRQGAGNILIGQHLQASQDLTQSATLVVLMIERFNQLPVGQKSFGHQQLTKEAISPACGSSESILWSHHAILFPILYLTSPNTDNREPPYLQLNCVSVRAGVLPLYLESLRLIRQ
jgi:hypothetical protein